MVARIEFYRRFGLVDIMNHIVDRFDKFVSLFIVLELQSYGQMISRNVSMRPLKFNF